MWQLSLPKALNVNFLTLLHSEGPKLHRVLAILSAVGLNTDIYYFFVGQGPIADQPTEENTW